LNYSEHDGSWQPNKREGNRVAISSLTSINYEDAEAIMAHVLAKAAADGGKPVAVCIVDAAGDQILAARQDGVKAPSVPNAHAKAVTAVKFERRTVEFRHELSEGLWVPSTDSWSELDIANALGINPIFCSWAGGVPIREPAATVFTRIIGGIGVSNREELQDHDLAASYIEVLTGRSTTDG
jgi:uncharacterized protein GlcG (DUF336 family)